MGCIVLTLLYMLQVSKKPGMEKEKLLDDSKEDDGGLWNSISRFALRYL